MGERGQEGGEADLALIPERYAEVAYLCSKVAKPKKEHVGKWLFIDASLGIEKLLHLKQERSPPALVLAVL